MKKRFFHMSAGLGIMALAAQQLHAQAPNCASREDVLKRLSESFGETRRGVGVARQGALMEVFASSETGTWTITVTLPDGTTCMIAAGDSYEALAEALPPNA